MNEVTPDEARFLRRIPVTNGEDPIEAAIAATEPAPKIAHSLPKKN